MHHIKQLLHIRHFESAPGKLAYAACLIWAGNKLIGGKPKRPAVFSRKDHGLISQTVAGN